MSKVIGENTIVRRYIIQDAHPINPTFVLGVCPHLTEPKVTLEFLRNSVSGLRHGVYSFKLDAEECRTVASWLNDIADVLQEDQEYDC